MSTPTQVRAAAQAMRRRRSSQPFGLSLAYLVLSIPLCLAGSTDISGHVHIGSASVASLITTFDFVILIGGALLLGTYSRALLFRILPFILLLLWTGASIALHPPVLGGIENETIYLLFGTLLIAAGSLAAIDAPEFVRRIKRAMPIAEGIALFLLLVDVTFHGLNPSVDVSWFVGPRSLAMFSLFPLSWHLAGWHYGKRYGLTKALMWSSIIVITLSRTATAAALLQVVLLAILELRVDARRAWRGPIPLVIGGGALLVALLFLSSALRTRFFGGDTSIHVGHVSINAMGRLAFWAVTIQSALTHPWIGQGVGSVEVLIHQHFPNMTHPHNDYLRLWHDLGAVGLGLWLLSVLCWCTLLYRHWSTCERLGSPSPIALVALLSLLAISVMMATDNAIVYVFVMAPLGIFVGGALGEPRTTDALMSSARHPAVRQPAQATT